MHDWTREAGIDERIILTKTDKLSNNQLIKARGDIARELEMDAAELIAASAVTRKGIDQIRREMSSRL